MIIPDFGGGFGGKHTGECAVEAARLAQAAGKAGPPALDPRGGVHLGLVPPGRRDRAPRRASTPTARSTSWHFVNINSGGNGIETPYRAVAKHRALRRRRRRRCGTARTAALAATANHFARECFMDELADARRPRPAGVPPGPPGRAAGSGTS